MNNAVKLEIHANAICAAVGQQLEKHYPGWLWFVECTITSGIVTVKNISLHGDYGFVLLLTDLLSDTDLRLPVTAGGELLERCNLPRGPRPKNLQIKRDIKGNAELDTHGAGEK